MKVNPWEIPRLWEGGTAFIIGGGLSMPRLFGVPEKLIKKVCDQQEPASVYSDYYKPLHDRHVIGINNAYKLGSWIDFLLFVDGSWFQAHLKGLERVKSVKVSCCNKFEESQYKQGLHVKYAARDQSKKYGLSDAKRKLVWNGNGGGAAIDLAVHLGALNIVLFGLDMKSGQISGKEVSHWHGAHYEKFKDPQMIKRPNYNKHLQCFKPIKRDAKAKCVRIYNCSPDSAIDCFEKVSLEEALKI